MEQIEEVQPQHARAIIRAAGVLLFLAVTVIGIGLFFDLLKLVQDFSLGNSLSVTFGIWGLVGGFGLYALRFDPSEWIDEHPALMWLFKRWVIGGISLSFVVGRFSVGWLSLAVGYLTNAFPFNAFFQFILCVFVAPVVQLVVGFFSSVTLFSVIIGVVMIVVYFPISMFQNIVSFERTWKVYKHSKTGLIAYLVQFAYWLSDKNIPPAAPEEGQGARFAFLPEVEKLIETARAAKHSTVFGHVAGQPLHIHTEKHVLIMASTRSGKGVSLIIPHLLRYPGSAFVLDPKGENAKATGRHRAALNDKVHYLDPFGISGRPRSRFNPLSRLTLENMEAESKALAAALVMGQQGGGASRDHWTASAQQLIALVIMFVFTSDSFPSGKKDLTTVRRILLEAVETALDDMMSNATVADGLLAAIATSFKKTPEKEFGSIKSTAQRETEILDNPFIAASLSASGDGEEVNFADWKQSKMTVYLCLSAPKFPVFNRWLRLVLTSALDEMTDTLNPPPLPVCFMLDELATLGHLSAVENAVGLSAGYGVQLFTVFQDTAQMKDLYRGRWASFVGNAGVRALFNLDDYDTAKYWSDTIGGHLVQTTSQQQDLYGYFNSQNVGETMRPLVSPSDMMLYLASGKMLVLPQGEHPIIADRVPYYQDKELSETWDDPRPGTQQNPVPKETPPKTPPTPTPTPKPEPKPPVYSPIDLKLGSEISDSWPSEAKYTIVRPPE